MIRVPKRMIHIKLTGRSTGRQIDRDRIQKRSVKQKQVYKNENSMSMEKNI
jgi:hypothetical protein